MNSFGPIGVGLPAVQTEYIMPNQRDSTCCQLFDQSESPDLKPKSETALKRRFHWAVSHPGWAFSCFLEKNNKNERCTWWPARGLKCLLCHVARTNICLCDWKSIVQYNAIVLCFFSTFCLLFLLVRLHFASAFCMLFFCRLFVLLLWSVLRFFQRISPHYSYDLGI